MSLPLARGASNEHPPAHAVGLLEAEPTTFVAVFLLPFLAGSICLADPKIKARLADLGGEVLALSPADFGKLIADETEKWAR
jgi:hypothetical protein